MIFLTDDVALNIFAVGDGEIFHIVDLLLLSGVM
jgi:hypothetical protein